MPAVPAASTGETMGQDAAFEVAAKLPLHVLWDAAASIVPLAGTLQIGLPDAPAPRGTAACARGDGGDRGRTPRDINGSLPTQTSPSCRRNDRIMIGEVIGKHFPAGQRPAHTLVGIGALALEGLLIEVEAMAVVED